MQTVAQFHIAGNGMTWAGGRRQEGRKSGVIKASERVQIPITERGIVGLPDREVASLQDRIGPLGYSTMQFVSSRCTCYGIARADKRINGGDE